LRALCCWKRKRRLGQSIVFAGLLSFGLAAAADLVQRPIKEILKIPTPENFDCNDLCRSRASVVSALEEIPGNHLVLIHYPQGHNFVKEWVFNSYDIPSQRIIWAHDLDPSDPDKPPICHYRDRHVWLLSPVDSEAWSVAQARRALLAVNTDRMCAAPADAQGKYARDFTSGDAAGSVN
jgi:hypothetical protein